MSTGGTPCGPETNLIPSIYLAMDTHFASREVSYDLVVELDDDFAGGITF
jgi:hypothetical protein